MNWISIVLKKGYRFLQKLLLFLAYGYSGLIVFYLILRLIFWDRLWFVAFVTSFIPWIFGLIFFLPPIAFWNGKQHRWFLVGSSIACILLISWLHLKYWSPKVISINSSQPSLKILSLNASWYKTRSETLVNLILQHQPDIVCLQEIVEKHTQRAFPMLKASYPYQASGPELGFLSKYPIRFAEIIHLANHTELQQRSIIKINQQEVVVYNMQATAPWIRRRRIVPFLSFKIPNYEYADRTAEIQDLVQRIQKETSPVIVAGDFNLTDQAQDYSYLAAVMQDAFQEAGRGFGFTWPHGWPLNFLIKRSTWQLNYPLFRLDYIWHSQDWQSKFAEVVSPTGSDHLPIVAELVSSQ